MPMFYFDTFDGSVETVDEYGVEVAPTETDGLRARALEVMAIMLTDEAARCSDAILLTTSVRGEDGAVVMRLSLQLDVAIRLR